MDGNESYQHGCRGLLIDSNGQSRPGHCLGCSRLLCARGSRGVFPPHESKPNEGQYQPAVSPLISSLAATPAGRPRQPEGQIPRQRPTSGIGHGEEVCPADGPPASLGRTHTQTDGAGGRRAVKQAKTAKRRNSFFAVHSHQENGSLRTVVALKALPFKVNPSSGHSGVYHGLISGPLASKSITSSKQQQQRLSFPPLEKIWEFV